MTARRDEGMTLVELLIGTAITVMIVSVVGTAFITALQLNQSTQVQLSESHDSQLVAAYLPADLLSAGSSIQTDPTAPTGCASSPTEPLNVARLTWSETSAGSSRHYIAAYRVRESGGQWQLVRYSCDAATSGGLTAAVATTQVVARNLRAVSAAADLPVLTTSGSMATLEVTDASGYQYTISGTRRVLAASLAAAAAPSAAPTASPAAVVVRPVVTGSELLGDAAGDVTVKVAFSLPVEAGCASRFTLDGLTGRGTYSGTAVLSGDRKSATLTVDRGANAPDTAVGGLRVDLDGEDATCSAADVADEVPTDKAAPVLLRMSTTNASGGTARELETGDGISFTFSEPVVNFPTALAVGLDGGTGKDHVDTLRADGVLDGSVSLGRGDYVDNSQTATASGTPARTANTWSTTLTLAACSGGSGSCATVTAAAGTAEVAYKQTSGLRDGAGNSFATGAAQPVTTAGFGAF